jgi:hypothetical protein
MRRPRDPLFLERRSYRQRRMGDAARMLPVLGLLLILLPVFWDPGIAGQPRSTAGDGMYLFVVWMLLIAVAALMSRGLTAAGRREARPAPPAPPAAASVHNAAAAATHPAPADRGEKG